MRRALAPSSATTGAKWQTRASVASPGSLVYIGPRVSHGTALLAAPVWTAKAPAFPMYTAACTWTGTLVVPLAVKRSSLESFLLLMMRSMTESVSAGEHCQTLNSQRTQKVLGTNVQGQTVTQLSVSAGSARSSARLMVLEEFLKHHGVISKKGPLLFRPTF